MDAMSLSARFHEISNFTPSSNDRFWDRTGQIIEIVVYVALSAFAAYVAPVAFAIGVGGSAISAIVIPAIIDQAGKNKKFAEGYLFPLLDDMMSGALLIGTIACSTKVSATAYKIAFMPAAICTLVGYIAPLAIFHEIKALV
ncbi:MAG: hypothetical protein Q8K75_04790 [Chlamydiales bacterium]|nr:hypothetical protein [Chlamydiales bacterium]